MNLSDIDYRIEEEGHYTVIYIDNPIVIAGADAQGEDVFTWEQMDMVDTVAYFECVNECEWSKFHFTHVTRPEGPMPLIPDWKTYCEQQAVNEPVFDDGEIPF